MVSIPNKVFELYNEFTDEMLASFGVSCDIFYIKKIQVTNSSVPTIKTSKSMRPYGKTKDFVQTDNYESVETSEPLRMRVYSTRKDFKKIADINVPDGGIMTICAIENIPKLRACDHITVNSENQALLGYKYRKVDNPIPWGIKKDRWCVCGWEKV